MYFIYIQNHKRCFFGNHLDCAPPQGCLWKCRLGFEHIATDAITATCGNATHSTCTCLLIFTTEFIVVYWKFYEAAAKSYKDVLECYLKQICCKSVLLCNGIFNNSMLLCN